MRHLYRTALTTASVTVAAAGAVLASAGGASAEVLPSDLGASSVPVLSDVVSGTFGTLSGATTSALGPALDLPLNPLSNSSTDPLNNSANTQIADFQPLSTEMLTGPLADGASADDLPADLLGGLLGLLSGAGSPSGS
jgi:hypothetical protein